MTSDETLAAIVAYATGRLDGSADLDLLSLRVVDTMASALGALGARPASIARALAAGSPSPAGCSVLGLAERASPEQAIFANTVAVRYLDYNDHYPGSGHPSDMIPALLAAAELDGISGARLLLAIDVAYEVATAVGDRNSFRNSGFDQGAHVAAGIAAGIGMMLRLPAAALAHAVSLAVTSTMPMRVTRTGELSDWKGCATAAVARNGFMAARLAGLGMSGPAAPFAGIEGLDHHAPPRGPLRLGPGADGLTALQRTSCKFYPVEGNAQAILFAVAEMAGELDPAEIAELRLETYQRAWHEIGGGQGDTAEKWDPQTRETADHSLPYLVAVMLTDRRVDEDSFAVSRVRDPALRPLMARIAVVPEPDLTALHPKILKSRISVTLRDGRTIRRETGAQPGDWRRPFTDEDVEAKYAAMARFAGPPEAVEMLRQSIRDLPRTPNVGALTAAVRSVMPAPQR